MGPDAAPLSPARRSVPDQQQAVMEITAATAAPQLASNAPAVCPSSATSPLSSLSGSAARRQARPHNQLYLDRDTVLI